jgi:hypothetical protein
MVRVVPDIDVVGWFEKWAQCLACCICRSFHSASMMVVQKVGMGWLCRATLAVFCTVLAYRNGPQHNILYLVVLFVPIGTGPRALSSHALV